MSTFIPDDKIEEVRHRSSIVDVVSGYVSLKKSGRNYVGLCPFHSEKTPSFTVSEEKGIFHCFGCGAGGNVFTFLMRVEGSPFPDVVRELAEREGIDLPLIKKGASSKKDVERDELFALHDEAAGFYHRLLMRSREGEGARSYLKGRGIDSETAGVWGLGFGGKGWSPFSDKLESDSSLKLADRAGLIIGGKRGRYYDRFRERLIFPICDLRGRVIAFGGRALDGGGPKYMNSPESPIYTKGNTLYGLNITKGAIREGEEAILVEGYMDLLSLYRFGIKNVVATLGTALTPAQAQLLKRYCNKVVLLFDSDEAGVRAALKAIEIFMESGVTPFVLSLPEGDDPDIFVRAKGADALRQEIKNAVSAVEFVLDRKLKGRPASTPSEKAAVIHDIVPFIRRIGDRVERTLTVSSVAERMAVAEKLILDAMITGSKGGRRRKAGVGEPSDKRSKGEIAEETILELMMGHKGVLREVVETGLVRHFRDGDLRLIGEKMEELSKDRSKITPSMLMDSLEGEGLKEKISAISMRGDMLRGCSPKEVFEDCEKIVRESSLSENERSINDRLRDAQQRGDQEEIDSLLEEKQKIISMRQSGKS